MNDFFQKFDEIKFKDFTNELCNLSPTEFVTLGSVIGIIMTLYLDPNKQNTLGNFLEMIGQILLTSYAQATIVNPDYKNFTVSQANELKEQILFFLKNKNFTK